MNINPDSIVEALNWRYATQVFDKSKTISPDNLKIILESARLAPSSFGIEAWKFIVVENPDVRLKLQKAGFGQPKITDASVLIVIAYRTDAKDNISKERVQRTAKTNNEDVSKFDNIKNMIDGSINNKTEAELESWVKSQSYIPLGIMILASSLLGIDSGPMEGFDPNAVDEILGLKEKNLHATSMLALGYRGDDPASKKPKVRRDFDEVIEFIK